jgi:hypothetical protein
LRRAVGIAFDIAFDIDIAFSVIMIFSWRSRRESSSYFAAPQKK